MSEVRAKIAHRLSREMGLSLADIARRLGVGTSAVAMAIRKKERMGKNEAIEQRWSSPTSPWSSQEASYLRSGPLVL